MRGGFALPSRGTEAAMSPALEELLKGVEHGSYESATRLVWALAGRTDIEVVYRQRVGGDSTTGGMSVTQPDGTTLVTIKRRVIERGGGRAVQVVAHESAHARLHHPLGRSTEPAPAPWHRVFEMEPTRCSARINTETTLPTHVALSDVLPPTIQPGDWANLPLGVGANGIESFDLRDETVVGIFGPSGSGRTSAVRTLAAGALARGHDIAIIDSSGWLKELAPYAVDYASGSDEAIALVGAIVAEEEYRRHDAQARGLDVTDVSPLTLFMDDVWALGHEAVASISKALHAIAPRLRAAGIRVVMSAQRLDATLPLRSLLDGVAVTSRPGYGPGAGALASTFPGMVEALAAESERLDDGRRGVNLLGRVGKERTFVRAPHASPSELVDLLAARGVEPVPADRKLTP